MGRAYSLDLREKVIAFINQGGSKRQASKIFGVGEDTIYRWIRREKQGKLAPKKRVKYPQKVDCEELLCYVKEHPDHTLKEIAIALKLGIKTVWKWLKRLNITRKKRRPFITKEMNTRGKSSKKH